MEDSHITFPFIISLLLLYAEKVSSQASVRTPILFNMVCDHSKHNWKLQSFCAETVTICMALRSSRITVEYVSVLFAVTQKGKQS